MKDYNPAFKRKRKLASEIPVGLPSTETVSIQTTWQQSPGDLISTHTLGNQFILYCSWLIPRVSN